MYSWKHLTPSFRLRRQAHSPSPGGDEECRSSEMPVPHPHRCPTRQSRGVSISGGRVYRLSATAVNAPACTLPESIAPDASCQMLKIGEVAINPCLLHSAPLQALVTVVPPTFIPGPPATFGAEHTRSCPIACVPRPYSHTQRSRITSNAAELVSFSR